MVVLSQLTTELYHAVLQCVMLNQNESYDRITMSQHVEPLLFSAICAAIEQMSAPQFEIAAREIGWHETKHQEHVPRDAIRDRMDDLLQATQTEDPGQVFYFLNRVRAMIGRPFFEAFNYVPTHHNAMTRHVEALTAKIGSEVHTAVTWYYALKSVYLDIPLYQFGIGICLSILLIDSEAKTMELFKVYQKLFKVLYEEGHGMTLLQQVVPIECRMEEDDEIGDMMLHQTYWRNGYSATYSLRDEIPRLASQSAVTDFEELDMGMITTQQ